MVLFHGLAKINRWINVEAVRNGCLFICFIQRNLVPLTDVLTLFLRVRTSAASV
ncbi:hypothetical protein ABE871_05905 [Enterococcus gilvus]|uniref:hypothetical protein n=1 Tax=Enterococcus gilvus TaxID=160453 RepID=UPI003D6AABB3